MKKEYEGNTVSECNCKPEFCEPTCYLITLPSSFDPDFMVRFLSRRRHLLLWMKFNKRLPLTEKEMSDRLAKYEIINRDITEEEETIMKNVHLHKLEWLNRLWVITNSRNEFALRVFMQLVNITKVYRKKLSLHQNCECKSRFCATMKECLNLVRGITFIFYPPNTDELWSNILIQLNNVFQKILVDHKDWLKKVIQELYIPEKNRDFSLYF